MVLFKLLPRGAQIQKVRAEINRGLLKNYGQLTELVIDRENKTISAAVALKGETGSIHIRVSRYQLVQAAGQNLVLALGPIEVSREWLQVLVQTLVAKRVIPDRMEIKNLLHQTVVRSLL